MMPNAVRFCFDVCARGTVVEDAALAIVEAPGRAICRDCGGEAALSGLVGQCCCGSYNLRIGAGEELRIKNMEIA